MRQVTRLLLLTMAAITAVGVADARAEGFITPFVGYNFGGDSANCLSLTNCQDKRTNYGVSFGSLSGFGFEEDISYAKDFFGSAPGSDNAVFTAMTNLLISVPAGPVHPYVVAGLGLIHPHVSGSVSSIANFDKNSAGYDFGGGLHIIFGRVGVRGDLRRFKTLQDIPLFTNQPLEYWRGSVGLTLTF